MGIHWGDTQSVAEHSDRHHGATLRGRNPYCWPAMPNVRGAASALSPPASSPLPFN